MVPCRQVGGDVFDYFELPDKRMLMAVADASGKGVPASLLMSSLRAALREIALPSMTTAQVAGHLNQQVHGMTSEHNFIACFLGILEPGTGVLNYSTAGIDPPLWWRHAPGRMERLERGGPVLGVLPDAHYFDGWIRLQPGDVLAAYSDGIVDEENGEQDSFGLERFTHELRRRVSEEAESIRDAVFQAVSEFSQGEATDDKTLLILKFHQNGASGTLSAASLG
jgi:sigma-B regulation protein RsbU (phosphoserine phosphatase)